MSEHRIKIHVATIGKIIRKITENEKRNDLDSYDERKAFLKEKFNAEYEKDDFDTTRFLIFKSKEELDMFTITYL